MVDLIRSFTSVVVGSDSRYIFVNRNNTINEDYMKESVVMRDRSLDTQDFVQKNRVDRLAMY